MASNVNIGDIVKVRMPLPDRRSEKREIPWNAEATVILPEFRIVEPSWRYTPDKELCPGVYPGDEKEALVSYEGRATRVAMRDIFTEEGVKKTNSESVPSEKLLFSLESFPCPGDTVLTHCYISEVTSVDYDRAIATHFGMAEDPARLPFRTRIFDSNSGRDASWSEVSVLERGNTWKYWWGARNDIYFQNIFQECSFLESVDACDYLRFQENEFHPHETTIETAAKKIRKGHADAISHGKVRSGFFRPKEFVFVVRFHDRERGERIRVAMLKFLEAIGL